ncbi:ATP-dependent endonuclease [Arthrobacter sp. NPDC056493]|uniref:ATP-dependent nuclease n=1 Tax=Arthrobacter sp. NPDC056493 TaxID=3345839 RepID=UPI0036732E58
MRIHDVRIENFRGIKLLEWRPQVGITALIGPGDSGKTTILDALGLLFSPRWSHSFTDNDFHKPENEVDGFLIRATIAEPPAELLGLDAFMPYIRGVDPVTGGIVDEPDTEKPALTIELRVDRFLEPVWQVVADRQESPGVLRASHRAAFGVVRVTSHNVADLRWSRNSALLRLTDSAVQRPTGQALIEASRAAKRATASAFHELSGVTSKVQSQAQLLRGLPADATLVAALNADSLQLNEGAVSLHSGEVPLERHGLGSRRLTGVAVQLTGAENARVLLVDELEAGLEPFRIRHLLRALEARVTDTSVLSQVFVTTHSPVVLRELNYSNLSVIRSDPATQTRAIVPGPTFQGALRKNAESFLAPNVLICEGVTEAGFARGVYAHAEESNPQLITAVATADAGGEGNLVAYAKAFADLGYRTAVFCDNDTKTDLSGLPLSTRLIRCDESKCTEQQVIASLSKEGLRRVLEHGLANSAQQAMTDALAARGCDRSVTESILSGGVVSEESTAIAGQALWHLAKKEGTKWFKSTTGGEVLAAIALSDDQATREPSPAARVVRELLAWGTGV